MEPLTWTGTLGALLNPFLYAVTALFVLALLVQIVMSLFASDNGIVAQADGTIARSGSRYELAASVTNWLGLALLFLILLYIVAGAFAGPGVVGIVGGMSQQLIPVWIALIVTFTVSIFYKRKLGLYGKLFD
ncbi:MAG: ABC transporter permease, partial [Pseudomonadota bacterium]